MCSQLELWAAIRVPALRLLCMHTAHAQARVWFVFGFSKQNTAVVNSSAGRRGHHLSTVWYTAAATSTSTHRCYGVVHNAAPGVHWGAPNNSAVPPAFASPRYRRYSGPRHYWGSSYYRDTIVLVVPTNLIRTIKSGGNIGSPPLLRIAYLSHYMIPYV